jgi:hypothetical protein
MIIHCADCNIRVDENDACLVCERCEDCAGPLTVVEDYKLCAECLEDPEVDYEG